MTEFKQPSDFYSIVNVIHDKTGRNKKKILCFKIIHNLDIGLTNCSRRCPLGLRKVAQSAQSGSYLAIVRKLER